MDLDGFDEYYKHLILWDQGTKEIIGSYRIGVGDFILQNYSSKGFYTSTLFDFSTGLIKNYLPFSIELGRSFIQPKYWKTNALENLWQGIGAFLVKHSNIRYLFGAVSISSKFPPGVVSAIVYYFNKWFGAKYKLAAARNHFTISAASLAEYQNIFCGDNFKKDYIILKKILKPSGCTVPILFKQYTDLCEEGGVQFLDFGIDRLFGGCIDGLILVDISLLKQEKKERFYKKYPVNDESPGK